ncbi:MAG: hypothetical protein Alpg2KO_21750 [Alphaproteobacteria bacterium]
MTKKHNEFREIDGSGNNLDNPDMGSAGTNLGRLTDAAYSDGVSAPSLADSANPRFVSDTVMAQGDVDTTNDNDISALFTIWGQFLVHDTDLTPDASGEELQPDGFLKPIIRSSFDPETGTDDSNPREHVNIITSWIDASNVYGSEEELTEFLREGQGGRMKVSHGDLLPFNTEGFENAGDIDPDNPLFLAGDIRCNENSALASVHTLWVREHNYWADRFASENPEWTDEELFQHAKMMVEAEIQSVTYDEWLPLLLGDTAMSEYDGYDPTVDASLSTEATTAALRIGHTLVTTLIPRINNDGTETEGGALSIRDVFFNNEALKEEGIDPILRGLVMEDAQRMDATIVDDLRTFLKAPDGAPNLDLAAINMMRARDHGIDSYTAVREQISDLFGLDLPPINDFSDITSDPDLAAALSLAYGGDVTKIDLWVGGLAEDSLDGSMLGPTFHHIILDQFERLRDGDRFFFEERLGEDLLDEVSSTSLSDIIARNTDTNIMQDDAFIAHIRQAGTDGDDVLTAGKGCPYLLMAGKGNDQVFGNKGDDDLYGQAGNDSLFGKDGDDLLFGGSGDDRLFGGMGDDELRGGAGNDELFGENDDDVLYGGADNDRLFGGEGENLLSGGAGDDELYGRKGSDILNGGSGDDLIIGGNGEDRVNGGSGNDTIWMGKGEDRVNGGDGDDIIGADRGADVVRAGDGDDIVYGATGDDRLFGQEGDDTIYGGSGEDRIDGGAGTDSLYGGNHADIFVFSEGNDLDTVHDFRLGEDRVDLRQGPHDSFAELVDSGSLKMIDADQPWLGTIIELGDSQMILEWVDMSQLGAGDFLI